MIALLIGIAAVTGLALGFMVGCFVGHAHAWALQDVEDEMEALGIG